MKFALDHVVIAVRDLGAAIDDYRALGFDVRPGGRHPPPRTSSNALVAFADGSYLELISWDPPNPAERWSNLLQEHGEGLVDYALLAEDLPRAVGAARSRGLPLDGPVDGRRLRPDGVQVRWQTARPATFELPFLCADLTPRALRVPEGAARLHENGALGIAEVEVAARDVQAALRSYEALLGSPALLLGACAIRVVEARGRREGPLRLVLRGPGRGLEGGRSHGVEMRFGERSNR